jgi:DNA-binding transcriptional regulator YiaG
MKLADYRKLVGLSRAAFAARVGTTGVTVYRWESGRMAASPANIRAVWAATQGAVSADDMLAPYHARKGAV